MKDLKILTWLTQLGFSILSPMLLCILGAVWLRDHMALGDWIVILGILLGLMGAVGSGMTFFRAFVPKEPKKPQSPPIGFNEHE